MVTGTWDGATEQEQGWGWGSRGGLCSRRVWHWRAPLLGSGCEVGCRGAAQPSVQGRGSHDAENPFWPCEPEWRQVPSFIPDLLALRNILQQVWAKAGRPDVALTYSCRAGTGI